MLDIWSGLTYRSMEEAMDPYFKGGVLDARSCMLLLLGTTHRP